MNKTHMIILLIATLFVLSACTAEGDAIRMRDAPQDMGLPTDPIKPGVDNPPVIEEFYFDIESCSEGECVLTYYVRATDDHGIVSVGSSLSSSHNGGGGGGGGVMPLPEPVLEYVANGTHTVSQSGNYTKTFHFTDIRNQTTSQSVSLYVVVPESDEQPGEFEFDVSGSTLEPWLTRYQHLSQQIDYTELLAWFTVKGSKAQDIISSSVGCQYYANHESLISSKVFPAYLSCDYNGCRQSHYVKRNSVDDMRRIECFGRALDYGHSMHKPVIVNQELLAFPTLTAVDIGESIDGNAITVHVAGNDYQTEAIREVYVRWHAYNEHVRVATGDDTQHFDTPLSFFNISVEGAVNVSQVTRYTVSVRIISTNAHVRTVGYEEFLRGQGRTAPGLIDGKRVNLLTPANIRLSEEEMENLLMELQ